MGLKPNSRNAPRVPRHFQAVVTRAATRLIAGETRELPAEVVDISRNGLGLIVSERFDCGALIRIRLILQDDADVTAAGRQWTTEGEVHQCTAMAADRFRLGIELRERSGRELEAWLNLVDRFSPRLF